MPDITKYIGKSEDPEIETIDFKPDDKTHERLSKEIAENIAKVIAGFAVIAVYSHFSRR